MWAEITELEDLSKAGGSTCKVACSHGWQTGADKLFLSLQVGFSTGLQGLHDMVASSPQEIKESRKEAAMPLPQKSHTPLLPQYSVVHASQPRFIVEGDCRPWTPGGHLRDWLPHLCPREASLGCFLEFAPKNRDSFPEISRNWPTLNFYTFLFC